MENQHRLIDGYRELTQEEIGRMNALKQKEREVLELMESCLPDADGRWMAIARTQMEQAFMTAGRAVARPEGYPQFPR